jgi:hypothetical protein
LTYLAQPRRGIERPRLYEVVGDRAERGTGLRLSGNVLRIVVLRDVVTERIVEMNEDVVGELEKVNQSYDARAGAPRHVELHFARVLTVHLLWSRAGPQRLWDEALSDALCGLCKSAMRFEAALGEFRGCAAWCVRARSGPTCASAHARATGAPLRMRGSWSAGRRSARQPR